MVSYCSERPCKEPARAVREWEEHFSWKVQKGCCFLEGTAAGK